MHRLLVALISSLLRNQGENPSTPHGRLMHIYIAISLRAAGLSKLNFGYRLPDAVLPGKLSHSAQLTADLTHFTNDSTQLTVHRIGITVDNFQYTAYGLQFKPHGLQRTALKTRLKASIIKLMTHSLQHANYSTELTNTQTSSKHRFHRSQHTGLNAAQISELTGVRSQRTTGKSQVSFYN